MVERGKVPRGHQHHLAVFVLLREIEGDRYLPIWIGAAEATAIAYVQQGVVPPRPLTHDLLKDVIGAAGRTLDVLVKVDVGFHRCGINPAAADAAGVPVLTQARVTQLFADPTGRIHGLAYQRPDGATESLRCQVLLLACNGFGGAPELVRALLPEMADALSGWRDATARIAARRYADFNPQT